MRRSNRAYIVLHGQGINVKTMPSSELSTHSSQLLALDFFGNVFEETSQDFETWLGAQEATQTAKQLGLRLRPRHRIHPKVVRLLYRATVRILNLCYIEIWRAA